MISEENDTSHCVEQKESTLVDKMADGVVEEHQQSFWHADILKKIDVRIDELQKATPKLNRIREKKKLIDVKNESLNVIENNILIDIADKIKDIYSVIKPLLKKDRKYATWACDEDDSQSEDLMKEINIRLLKVIEFLKLINFDTSISDDLKEYEFLTSTDRKKIKRTPKKPITISDENHVRAPNSKNADEEKKN